MRVLAFATDSDGYLPLLLSSADRFGFELEIVGWGTAWHGMTTKLTRYHEELRRRRSDEVVMLIDAYDVFFAAPAALSAMAFKEMGLPYLLSGQRYFPSSPFMRELSDRVMGLDPAGRFGRRVEAERYGRPCMGALMGHAGALTELLSKLIAIEERQRRGDDQVLLNLYLEEHPEEAYVDRECRIFQSLWRTRGSFSIAGSFHPNDADAEVRILASGRLENRFTRTCPQVIHGPMDLDMNPLLEALGYDVDGLERTGSGKYFYYGMGNHLKHFLETGAAVLKRRLAR